jgi:hypothetical protein
MMTRIFLGEGNSIISRPKVVEIMNSESFW